MIKMWKLPNITPMRMTPLEALSFEISRHRHDEETRRRTNVANFRAHSDIIRTQYINDTSHTSIVLDVRPHLGPAVKDIAALRLVISFLPMMKALDRIQDRVSRIRDAYAYDCTDSYGVRYHGK